MPPLRLTFLSRSSDLERLPLSPAFARSSVAVELVLFSPDAMIVTGDRDGKEVSELLSDRLNDVDVAVAPAVDVDAGSDESTDPGDQARGVVKHSTPAFGTSEPLSLKQIPVSTDRLSHWT